MVAMWSINGQFLRPIMPKPTQVTINGSLIRWEADFGRIGGKRRRKYYKTKGQAIAALRLFKEEKDEAGRVWAQLAPSKRAKVSTVLLEMSKRNVSLDEVWTFFKEHHAAKTGRTLGDARDEFLEAKKAAGFSALYLDQLRVCLRLFVLDREGMDISQLNHKLVSEYLSTKKGAPSTRQTHLNRLSSFFSYCVRVGYLAENPAQRVERVRVPHIDPQILSVEECQRLVDVAAVDDLGMLTYLGLALFCGIRPEEALRITEGEIDIKRGLVFLKAEKAKVRNRRIVTLTKPALECIKAGNGVPVTNFKRRFNALRKSAEIENWPHDALRKTAASHFYNVYGIEKATEQLGHSASVFLGVYRELVSKEDTESWLAISPRQ